MNQVDDTQPDPVTINDFVDELVVGLMNTRIYWSDHPRVAASVAELRRILPELGGQIGKPVVEIFVAEDQLVFERRPLLGASLSAPRLIKAVHTHGGGGIRFGCQADDSELCVLLRALTDKARVGATLRDFNDGLEREQCRQVELLPTRDTAEQNETEGAMHVPVQLYQSLVENLQDTTISLCHGGMVHFDKSQACVENVMRSLETQGPGGMMHAVRYERYDAYTFGHSIRVSLLALAFARTLTPDTNLLNRIGVAALLHDVGKVRVPFEVLHCRTRLDAEQRAEMEKHAVYGAEILLDQANCDPMAYGAAFGHHLGADGQGYPKLRHTAEISLVTKIVKICDVFEALTAERPYKASMSPLRAYRIMIGMGDVFDRRLLKRFIRAIGVFPAGTRVELATGEAARVVDQTADPLRPVLQLETTPDGDVVSPEDQRLIDLSTEARESGSCLGCNIARVLDLQTSPA